MATCTIARICPSTPSSEKDRDLCLCMQAISGIPRLTAKSETSSSGSSLPCQRTSLPRGPQIGRLACLPLCPRRSLQQSPHTRPRSCQPMNQRKSQRLSRLRNPRIALLAIPLHSRPILPLQSPRIALPATPPTRHLPCPLRRLPSGPLMPLRTDPVTGRHTVLQMSPLKCPPSDRLQRQSPPTLCILRQPPTRRRLNPRTSLPSLPPWSRRKRLRTFLLTSHRMHLR